MIDSLIKVVRFIGCYEFRSFTQSNRKNFGTGCNWVAFGLFYLRREKRGEATKKPDLLKLDRPEGPYLFEFIFVVRIGAVQKLSPVKILRGKIPSSPSELLCLFREYICPSNLLVDTSQFRRIPLIFIAMRLIICASFEVIKTLFLTYYLQKKKQKLKTY